MAALSVIGSVVGILSVTAKLITVSTDLIKKGKQVPESVHSIVSELNDLRACLRQLQPYIHGTGQASSARGAMISIDQVITINTSCVLALSGLEEMLDSFNLYRPLSRFDKLRWVKNESRINRLLLRIRASKSSLNLILVILTCVSVQEAQETIGTLIPTVDRIRHSSEDVSQRLAALESEFASRIPREGSMLQTNNSLSPLNDLGEAEEGQPNCTTPIPDQNVLTTRSQLASGALQVIDPNKTPSSKSGLSTLCPDLELVLEGSRPYARLCPIQQTLSASSFSHFSGRVSCLSGVMLSDISDLSVFSLPISIHEIWNSQHYSTSLDVQRSHSDRRKPSTSVINLAGTMPPSLDLNEKYSGEECEEDPVRDEISFRSYEPVGTSLVTNQTSFRSYDSVGTSSTGGNNWPLNNLFVSKRHFKVLLIGIGESGKSTILKQKRLASADTFHDEEREAHRAVLFSNLVVGVLATVEEIDKYGWQYQEAKSSASADTIKSFCESDEWNCTFHDEHPYQALPLRPLVVRVLAAIQGLWIDAVFQEMLKRGNEYAQYDNIDYCFQHKDRLFIQSQHVSDEDCLRASRRTSGITYTLLDPKQIDYQIFDVGGARWERKKWVHAFKNVDCLFFVAPLAGYDKCLVEDTTANQMEESFLLFQIILELTWFKETSIVLLLSKMDIFKQKIKKHAVREYFPNFAGLEGDYKSTVTYFINRFRALQPFDDRRKIHIYVVDAIDTSMMQKCLRDINNKILIPNHHAQKSRLDRHRQGKLCSILEC